MNTTIVEGAIKPAASIRFVCMALAFAASVSALAQEAATKTTPTPASPTYTPSVGQPGKDVIWVPTPQALVDRMLDMAKVTRNDYVIDLGSGDGRLVITAAKRGARALGIEYEPQMVELSKRNAKQAGVTGRAQFMKADLFETDFSEGTVITMFLLPQINLQLRPKLLELKPGTRVVSNSFDMGDWKPDETVTLQRRRCAGTWCTAHLWIVPAHVEGTYQTAEGEFSLKQQYQMVSGTLKTSQGEIPVEGKIRGDEVMLRAGGRALRARANGTQLELQTAKEGVAVGQAKMSSTSK